MSVSDPQRNPTAVARSAFRRLRVELPQPWSRRLGQAAYLPSLLRSEGTRRSFHEEAAIERLIEHELPLVDQGARVLASASSRFPGSCANCRDRPAGCSTWARRSPPPSITASSCGCRPPERHGVDLAPFSLPGVVAHQADARALPFADGSFDRVICISALEHMGLDNERYLGADNSARDKSET